MDYARNSVSLYKKLNRTSSVFIYSASDLENVCLDSWKTEFSKDRHF